MNLFPFQFLRFHEDNPWSVEPGVWIKVSELVAWLETNGQHELAEMIAEAEDARIA